MKKVILVTVPVLLVYLTLAFMAGTWLGLGASRLWVFRAAISLIGLVAAAFAIWFFWNRKKQEDPKKQQEEAANPEEEIGALIREAARNLPKSRGRFGSLPVVFVLGEPGSAKTSTIVHSGLDAELLAGHVFQDSDIVPTRAANLWYGKGTLFVEAAGKFADDSRAWTQIARSLQPGGLGAALSKAATAATAAIVTINAESLFPTDAGKDLAASARRLRARLIEISQALGVHLPVYVLLTRMDQVPFFVDFTRRLSEKEASQVMGATVPMTSGGEGVYAEKETARLTAAFEQLFRSLCSFRPVVLAREFDADNLPGAYEFPRELQKLRPNLIPFLADLCRPSQLTVGPFLRGFYFSGVRPVVVTEAAGAAAAAGRGAAEGATTMFRLDGPLAQPKAAAPQKASRRVPQWVFLSHFFQYLILSDQSARDASGASTKTSLLRRVLLLSACAVCLLYSVALSVSFFRNHSLQVEVSDAARGLQLAEVNRLEPMRQSLARVTAMKRTGASLGYHWGLYSIDDIYLPARRIYFGYFRKMLLAPTQTTLVAGMRALPATPGPEYGPTYDSLKAYLITTSNPEKSTRAFLSPVLTSRWNSGQAADTASLPLIQKQFDFYSDELPVDNPFPPDSGDRAAIEKSRRYLGHFGDFQRVYNSMLAGAAKSSLAINFNRSFPGSAETVVDSYEVEGPFTKQGWDFMVGALKNPGSYFSGDDWVMGPQRRAEADLAKLSGQLTAQYSSDYITQWRNYLKAAVVVKYKDMKDAAAKLSVLSGNQSTLLALLSLASNNTAVDDKEVSKMFQPVQTVMAPPVSADHLVAPANQPYMMALQQLQASVETASPVPELTDQLPAAVQASAVAARAETRKMALPFRADPEGHVDAMVQKLLEDPITNLERMVNGLDKGQLNAKGKEFCGQYGKLLSKYPFSAKPGAPQASIADVNAIFRPGDGALWAFYDSSLKKLLVKKEGKSDYEPVSGGSVTLTPPFVKYFNHAAALSELWYANGAKEPHFRFTIKPLAADNILGGLQIEGQPVVWSSAPGASKQLTWQANAQNETKGNFQIAGGKEFPWPNKHGLWSLFQFFGEAENRSLRGDVETLEWVIKIGNDPMKVDGKSVTVGVELSMPGEPPVFQKGYLGNVACIADVAR